MSCGHINAHINTIYDYVYDIEYGDHTTVIRIGYPVYEEARQLPTLSRTAPTFWATD